MSPDPIAIREPTADDAEAFLAAVKASRSLHHPWVNPADTPERFAEYLKRAAQPDTASYLVLEGGSLAGYITISNIVRGLFCSGYLGYGAFAAGAGRGLMTAGMQAVVEEAFGPLGLHRLEANIQPTNTRSQALVRRLGFRREGFSPRYLKVDGDWRDHERYALTAEDWHKAVA